MAKLEELKVNGTIQLKQLKLVSSALKLVYSLANANVIRDGVPFQQFIGPITLN